jgi:hypothetical protein
MNNIEHIINHIRNRSYMSGIERDKARVKATGEVFTPTPLVQEILDTFDQEVFVDPTKTFLDPTCGDGQFLGEVLIRKLENGISFEQALVTIYGVDLMQDNVDLCRERLLCGSKDPAHIAIVEQNIYQADGLKFSYKFKPMTETRRKREESRREKEKRDKEKRLKEEERKQIEEQKSKIEKKLFGQTLI